MGRACPDPAHRPYWFVTDRLCNHSAFNGYRRTRSAYSSLNCPLCPALTCHWRSKADYVWRIPDERERVVPSKSKELVPVG